MISGSEDDRLDLKSCAKVSGAECICRLAGHVFSGQMLIGRMPRPGWKRQLAEGPAVPVRAAPSKPSAKQGSEEATGRVPPKLQRRRKEATAAPQWQAGTKQLQRTARSGAKE